jgi:hypothetical protein
MKTKGVNGIGSQASQKSNAGKNKQTISFSRLLFVSAAISFCALSISN